MGRSLLVPEYLNGVPTFVPYAADIQRKLKEGDPSIGWEGDERLYISPRDGAEGYAVGRLCEDGVKRLICVSTPDSNGRHILDEGLLIRLRDSDTRKNDVLKRIELSDAARRKENDDRMHEKVSEAMERVVWGLNKDQGHHY